MLDDQTDHLLSSFKLQQPALMLEATWKCSFLERQTSANVDVSECMRRQMVISQLVMFAGLPLPQGFAAECMSILDDSQDGSCWQTCVPSQAKVGIDM